jgi:hypothetical protein
MALLAHSADGEISPSAHSAVSVDGARLTELIAALPLSRGSIFEIIKALGIVTTKGPGAGGKGRVAWVSNADSERLFDAAHRVNRGEVRIADLAGVLTPQTRQTPPLTLVPDSADPADPELFISRLQAAELAVASGLGLTTREVAWILGVNPGGAFFIRGGITCTKTGKNCWLLASVKS